MIKMWEGLLKREVSSCCLCARNTEKLYKKKKKERKKGENRFVSSFQSQTPPWWSCFFCIFKKNFISPNSKCGRCISAAIQDGQNSPGLVTSNVFTLIILKILFFIITFPLPYLKHCHFRCVMMDRVILLQCQPDANVYYDLKWNLARQTDNQISFCSGLTGLVAGSG